jgi:hypothetical protein
MCYENGVLRSSTIIISGPVCPFMSSSICFMNLDVQMFGAHIFTIIDLEHFLLFGSIVV